MKRQLYIYKQYAEKFREILETRNIEYMEMTSDEFAIFHFYLPDDDFEKLKNRIVVQWDFFNKETVNIKIKEEEP